MAVASNSQGMDLIFKVFEVSPDSEVITTPYTYVATSNTALHRGIKPTFVDLKKDSFFMDEENCLMRLTQKRRRLSLWISGACPLIMMRLKRF